MTNGSEGSILSAIVWMFIISILLFWLPVVGPLVAGFVGGMKAGGVGSAVLATTDTHISYVYWGAKMEMIV